MRFTTLVTIGELASLALAITRNGISERGIMEEVEHVMVDQYGYNQDPFVSAITPCGTYLTVRTLFCSFRIRRKLTKWCRVIKVWESKVQLNGFA